MTAHLLCRMSLTTRKPVRHWIKQSNLRLTLDDSKDHIDDHIEDHIDEHSAKSKDNSKDKSKDNSDDDNKDNSDDDDDDDDYVFLPVLATPLSVITHVTTELAKVALLMFILFNFGYLGSVILSSWTRGTTMTMPSLPIINSSIPHHQNIMSTALELFHHRLTVTNTVNHTAQDQVLMLVHYETALQDMLVDYRESCSHRTTNRRRTSSALQLALNPGSNNHIRRFRDSITKLGSEGFDHAVGSLNLISTGLSSPLDQDIMSTFAMKKLASVSRMEQWLNEKRAADQRDVSMLADLFDSSH
jgi:hypothetical protein